MKTAWFFIGGRQVADRNGLVARSPRTNEGILFKNFKCFATITGILFCAFVAGAQTNGPSDAEVQGQQLVKELLVQKPDTNFFEKASIIIRHPDGTSTNIPVLISTLTNVHGWEADYSIFQHYNKPVQLVQADQAKITITGSHLNLNIMHINEQSNVYLFDERKDWVRSDRIFSSQPISSAQLDKTQIMASFAGSDFWICDLGLEFLHWPGQKVIKKEFMRGRGCMVLESTNPIPTPNGYSRVDSWIDEETLGIVHAEAYDANSKLLKIFDPKSFKKVNGQWELQEMEMRNVQTGSRTRIEFDLKPD